MSKASTTKATASANTAQRKLPALGTVNGAMRATLWRGNVIVGYCIDTTNSLAYGMRKTGADRSTSWLGEKRRGEGELTEERIADGGNSTYMKTDADALFSLP